jgi:pilus assembly protein CpaC
VQPVSEKIVTLPTDGFAPASDFDLYLLGRLHDVYRREEETTAMGRVQGPIGYIME